MSTHFQCERIAVVAVGSGLVSCAPPLSSRGLLVVKAFNPPAHGGIVESKLIPDLPEGVAVIPGYGQLGIGRSLGPGNEAFEGRSGGMALPSGDLEGSLSERVLDAVHKGRWAEEERSFHLLPG